MFRLSSIRCHKPTAKRTAGRGRLAPAALAVALLASLTTACSSSQEGGSTPSGLTGGPLSSSAATTTAPPQSGAFATELPSSAAPETATPTHSSAPISYAMGGTAENGQGDRVRLTLSFESRPRPATLRTTSSTPAAAI